METCSWVELTNRATCGTLFQNTMASGPKLCPFNVMTKGVLLTGTVLGSTALSAGGVKLVPKVAFRSCVVVPQPMERTRANPTTQKAQTMGRRAKRQVERIAAS